MMGLHILVSGNWGSEMEEGCKSGQINFNIMEIGRTTLLMEKANSSLKKNCTTMEIGLMVKQMEKGNFIHRLFNTLGSGGMISLMGMEKK